MISNHFLFCSVFAINLIYLSALLIILEGDVSFANSGGGIDMKCEGRGSIVTSPVDVMDDIHGSTPPTANKQSYSSFTSLEEDKGSADVETTSEDIQLRTGVTSKSTGKYCSWAH